VAESHAAFFISLPIERPVRNASGAPLKDNSPLSYWLELPHPFWLATGIFATTNLCPGANRAYREKDLLL
jgi:hypothetical protein